MPYRTLGELRDELRARLGMGATGSSAVVNQTILNSFLRNGQRQLYLAGAWKRLHRYRDDQIGVNQYLMDYPPDADKDRILRIAVNIGTSSSPNWQELEEGISPQHYNTQHLTSWPKRWQCYEQIELWPKSNAIYTVRVFYIKDLDRFTQDGDRATIDDEMILLHALANAKLHYRQPDAQIYGAQLEAVLGMLKSMTWPKWNFSRGAECDVPPKPVVV